MPQRTLSEKASRIYQTRNNRLAAMGFASYHDYLASSLWSAIREKVLHRDKRKCRGCGEPATQVHHGHYGSGALRGTDILEMYAVCDACHGYIEFNHAGEKVTPAKATKLLRRIGKCDEKPSPRPPRTKQPKAKPIEVITKQTPPHRRRQIEVEVYRAEMERLTPTLTPEQFQAISPQAQNEYAKYHEHGIWLYRIRPGSIRLLKSAC